MPIIEQGSFITPLLQYDAPVNEKTQAIRDRFKIDESGYPEHYKWRGLARLGQSYTYEDAFTKLTPYDPNSNRLAKFNIICLAVGSAALAQYAITAVYTRPFYSKPHYPIGIALTIGYLGKKLHEAALRKQAQKNAIAIDYVKKHPERFEEPRYRPKYREILSVHVGIH